MAWWSLGVLAFAIVAAPPAAAQNAGTELIRPWPNLEHVEASAGATFQPEADASGPSGSGDVQIFQYRGHVRWRLSPTDPNTPRAAIQVNSVDLVTDDIGLADQFVNISAAAGMGVDLVEDQWRLAGALGVGSASNHPFDDPDGLYGTAALLLTWYYDAKTSITFSLTYDGNRTIWPDLPLPGITIQTAYFEDFLLTLGLPLMNVRWTPIDDLRISLSYIVPDNVYFSVEYDVIEQLTLYTKFDQITEAYHLDGDSDDRRVLFNQRRIELGAEGRPIEQLEITLGVGYAFSQDFERGWDVRNTNKLFDLSDEPYARLAATLWF